MIGHGVEQRGLFADWIVLGSVHRLLLPTARKKEEVPRWFVLAANLSLKLHQENSFLAFERVVRGGGLLSALPPEIASKHLDPQTRQILLECQGFNDKNSYQRSTPCDQDFLRKFVKEVTASQWMEWFNGPVQQVFHSYGFFDPAGIFIGDGSYLFVPDNEAYEGSAVMWFDEHNHAVDYEKLTGPERKKAHRERCYKLVSLLHRRGDAYVYAALAVVPGNAHEDPVLYELVENFVRHVGRGVIKLLILDRGFIDGPNITRCKREWGIDVLLPVKKNMDIWTDAWALAKQAPWQPWSPPVAPPPAPPPNRPEVIVRRERKRQKTLAAQAAKQPPPPPEETLLRTELCPVKGCTSWTECKVPMNVLLLRERYADGHQDQWALMTTADFAHPARPKEQYQWRATIEERHRLLKCFYDLSDFHSRSLSVITAQVVFILLSYTLRQWQLWRLRQDASGYSYLVGFGFLLARASIGSPHRNRSHGPLKHFLERDENVPSNVLTAKGFMGFFVSVRSSIGIDRRSAARSAAASTKELFKKITEARALKLEIILITPNSLLSGSSSGSTGLRARLPACFPVGTQLIVLLATVRMAQDLIGFVDFLEFLLRHLLVFGDIGVILPRQRAESLLDFLVRGLGRHSQDPIIVLEFSGHDGLVLRASDH